MANTTGDSLSFEPLLNAIDAVAAYTQAIQIGNTKFVNALPIQFKSTISKLAGQRLNHTADNYTGAVTTEFKEDVLVVALDADNWLAAATEVGKDEWQMVKTHLSNAKTSKAGYKYKVIPLRVWTTSPGAKTQLGMDYFDKVKKILKNPKFGKQWQSQSPTGSTILRREVVHDDPDLQGMFSIREYESQSDLVEGKKPKQAKYILFRTMSEKFPDKWVHPGIKPANILKDALTLVENEIEENWTRFINEALAKKGF